MKIALLDSDTVFLEKFRLVLEECLRSIGMQHCRIITSSEGEEFVEQEFKSGKYLLMFIDIRQEETETEELRGLEIAKQIRSRDKRVALIFTSSVNDYATESYQVDASYFLVKPMDQEDCYRALNKVLYRRSPKHWTISLSDHVHVFLGEIVYIRQMGNEIILYMIDQSSHVVSARNLNLDRMIEVFRCLHRVDKETVINLDCVESVDNRAVFLTNNHYISISKKQVENVKEHLMNMSITQSKWKM